MVDIEKALDALQRGEIVAMPTDTVYGIAASLARPDAIEAIYRAKGRDADKALPVLVDSRDQILRFAAGDTARAEMLARSFWPGALTIVVVANEALPWGIHRGAGTVGLRMPANDIALGLITAAGGALAVTSANLSGRPEARSAEAVRDTLGESLGYIIDGGHITGGMPSTVVDLTGRIYRSWAGRDLIGRSRTQASTASGRRST